LKTLFIAPHADDESLWGAYTIMALGCSVAVFVDDATKGGTKTECVEACEILGVKNLSFVTDIAQIRCDFYDRVFVPYPERGNRWHDDLSNKCSKYFPNAMIRYYMAYGPDKTKPPFGKVKAEATDDMKAKKLLALNCYKSQHESAAVHFNIESKDEYFFA
jgi:LmbE family N-acetylglucosaminyl deacetylase